MSTADLYAGAEVILRVQKPSAEEAGFLHSGQAVIGLLQPLLDPALMATLGSAGVTVVSLDAIPRTLCAPRRWMPSPARRTRAATRPS